ncbi:amino acid transporter [Phlyctema vagabunda]|uniref:Amino acid transporter n=1 Tax=Phlyctema vagabunda TaxID=108571 RepID=A0ABR4P9K5_9HELO
MSTSSQTGFGLTERKFSDIGAFDDGDNFENEDSYHSYLGSTFADRKDMDRMGKIQELRRNFRPLSSFSFTVVIQGTWEALLVATTQGLGNGGLAGLFWMYIWTFLGMGLVNLSLAEMASMAPTAGGQYHWVSEFSPAKYQKALSHFTGWMSTLSLQAGAASGMFLIGTIIQAYITANYPEYTPTQWQGTLFVCATTIPTVILNVWASRAMPVVQNIMIIIHLGGWLAIIIILWTLSPRNTADTVFLQFVNESGWHSMGLTLMVGQSSVIYSLIGSDMAAHISEEIKNAAVTVPQAMLSSYLVNSLMGLIFLITYLFVMTNIDAALADETEFPFIWVFRQALSPGGVSGLMFIPLVMCFAGTLSFNLATSRASWAFSRDAGLPFSKFLARIDPKLHLPVNSILANAGFIVAISLINLGSDVAFDAIVSLNLVSLMATYMICIGCVLFRRLRHPASLPKSQFSLGRMGVPINIAALLYSSFAFFWCFWPSSTPITLGNYNWGSLMFVIVTVVALADYIFRAKKVFRGPVAMTRSWRMA